MNIEAIKNLSAVSDALALDVSMVSCATFFAKVNGSVAGHNVTFQYSLDSTNGVDGTWLSLPCSRIATTPTVESTSGSFSGTPTYAWRANISGIPWVRVLTSAHSSGSMAWQISGHDDLGTEAMSSTVGSVAHDAPMAGNPVRVAGRARSTNYAATSADDVADVTTTLTGAVVTKDNAPFGAHWRFSGTLTTTADSVLKSAAGSGLFNTLTDLILQNTNATATIVNIKDGSTVISQVSLPANMTLPIVINFNTALLSSINAALNIAAATTGANVLVTASGYSGA